MHRRLKEVLRVGRVVHSSVSGLIALQQLSSVTSLLGGAPFARAQLGVGDKDTRRMLCNLDVVE